MWDGYSDDDLDENKYSHNNTKSFNADDKRRRESSCCEIFIITNSMRTCYDSVK